MPQQFTNRHNRTISVDRKSAVSNISQANYRQSARFTPTLLVTMFVVGGALLFSGSNNNSETGQASLTQPIIAKQLVETKLPNINYRPFPLIDESKLTAVQKNLVAIIKSEYAKHPTGYDESVMAYTEGIKEPWCANFISWVRDEAGIPYEHPTTDYWRIPGVSTLRDYYRQYDAYFVVGDYVPKLGDVAFYEGDTADSNSSEHVALVLGVEGDKLYNYRW